MRFTEFIEQFKWLPSFNVTFIDIVQMVILALTLYYLTKTLYKTRAWILVKGMFIIGAVYLVIWLTEMTVLQTIMQGLFSTLLIAIVIMLQPELQKIVELIGKRKFTNIKTLLFKKQDVATWYSEKTIYEISAACEAMSEDKTGALIVIERGIPLKEYINSGIGIGATTSRQLLLNIFEKNTPLHDGAVVIANDKIESATCYLPLSTNYDIDKHLGTRHRSALGISETTDCVVVVVSEETGAISFCSNGNLKHDINRSDLARLLKANMNKQDEHLIPHKKSNSPVWMKILAPILSVVIWIAVIAVNDPIITKTITDIPVKIVNEEVLGNAGQAYSVKSGSVISAKVKGKRSLVDGMDETDILAIADFSEMSSVYAVPITMSTQTGYDDVEIVDGSNVMKLEIEEMIQTDIPIEVKIVGDKNMNVVVNVQEVELTTLTVTCPKSFAKTLDKALLTIDAKDKENDFIINVTPVVYDKNGNEVATNKISLSQETVRVYISVHDVQEIPITISFAEQDNKADCYYVLNGYEAEFDTIRVAGDDDVMYELQEINVIVYPDVNSNNANTVMVNLHQYLPEGVHLAKNQEEQLPIDLNITKYQKLILDLAEENVKVVGYDTNAQDAKIIEAPSKITLHYNVDLIDPSTITIEMLNPTIKTQEINLGDYEGAISLTEIDGVIVAEELFARYNLSTKR